MCYFVPSLNEDFDETENHYSMDMKDIINCRKVSKGVIRGFSNQEAPQKNGKEKAQEVTKAHQNSKT